MGEGTESEWAACEDGAGRGMRRGVVGLGRAGSAPPAERLWVLHCWRRDGLWARNGMGGVPAR